MIKELFREQRALMLTGSISFVCAAILTIFSQFDSTEILGINRWIKPLKFFASIGIFVWTVAVYLTFLKGWNKSARFISWAMIAVFVIEMTIIIGQALRGTTSHFNVKTPFDGMLFAIMGLAIAFNTLLVIYLFFLYFVAEIELPKSIVLGMRFGLILFLAACFQGAYMSSQTGHAVGASDGGAGLPIVNWSTEVGDLRVAHFIGMHALQVVPLFAYALDACKISRAALLTTVFAVLYGTFFVFVFVQALQGKPFLSGF